MKRTFLNLFILVGLAALAPGAAAQDTGQVFVIHGIPGLPADVDVYANGDYVDSFGFTDSIGPLDLPADSYFLEVKLGGVSVLSATANVMAGGNYTAIAHLTEPGGIALSLYENDNSALNRGRTRLTIRHNAQAPEVAVRLSRGENGKELVTVPGLTNPNQIGPLEVKPGGYNAGLLVGDTEVFNSGKLELSPGTAYVVYAIGVFPESFQLFIESFEPSPKNRAMRR